MEPTMSPQAIDARRRAFAYLPLTKQQLCLDSYDVYLLHFTYREKSEMTLDRQSQLEDTKPAPFLKSLEENVRKAAVDFI